MEQNNTLVVGTTLKGANYNYLIEKVLGQGSFGITYLASTEIEGPLGSITVPVALKEFFMGEVNGREGSTVTSSANSGLYDKYRRKFIGEAHNLSRLQHPNIIHVLETFEANNTVYYSMEYLDRGSLDGLIQQRGRLPESEALPMMRQVAEALRYMHGQNVLHLDLKPANIMLGKQGQPVLIDFGLSKQYDDNGNPESSITVGGGTPGYAPIEQANYGGHDGKSALPTTMDVYALGATLFKMLTGLRPPDATVVFTEGFPKEDLVGVSQPVVSLIEHAMQPNRKQRTQSAEAFLAELTPLLSKQPSEENPANQANNDQEETQYDNSTTTTSKPQNQPQNQSPQSTPAAKKQTTENQSSNTKRKAHKKAWIWGSVGALVLAVCVVLCSITNRIKYEMYYGIGEAKVIWHSAIMKGKINIPSTIKRHGMTLSVTSIGLNAFLECDGLTSITIPNSVTSIGDHAFAYCMGLTSVYIPNSVTNIGSAVFAGSGLTDIIYHNNQLVYVPTTVTGHFDIQPGTKSVLGAFYECSGLTSVTIPNTVTFIGDESFYACEGLTSVTIPSSVTSIGDCAFAYCSGLTSVIIPNSVTSIGNEVFRKCRGLTSVTIPNSVTSIGEEAFKGCYSLTSVTIPNSVISLEEDAFAGCDGLTSVTIPASVTSIGDYAFGNCDALKTVVIENPNCEIADDAFEDCHPDLEIIYK